LDENAKIKKKYFESGLLRLNCKKANKLLKWKTVLKFDELMNMVADWYKHYYLNKKNVLKITSKQIKKYESLAAKRGLRWIKIN
jgi:CDP-glucose 4,6-dehydratase